MNHEEIVMLLKRKICTTDGSKCIEFIDLKLVGREPGIFSVNSKHDPWKCFSVICLLKARNEKPTVHVRKLLTPARVLIDREKDTG